MPLIIAIEQDAKDIGGSGTPIANKCLTKDKVSSFGNVKIIDSEVNNYTDKQLVAKAHLEGSEVPPEPKKVSNLRVLQYTYYMGGWYWLPSTSDISFDGVNKEGYPSITIEYTDGSSEPGNSSNIEATYTYSNDFFDPIQPDVTYEGKNTWLIKRIKSSNDSRGLKFRYIGTYDTDDGSDKSVTINLVNHKTEYKFVFNNGLDDDVRFMWSKSGTSYMNKPGYSFRHGSFIRYTKSTRSGIDDVMDSFDTRYMSVGNTPDDVDDPNYIFGDSNSRLSQKNNIRVIFNYNDITPSNTSSYHIRFFNCGSASGYDVGNIIDNSMLPSEHPYRTGKWVVIYNCNGMIPGPDTGGHPFTPEQWNTYSGSELIYSYIPVPENGEQQLTITGCTL